MLELLPVLARLRHVAPRSVTVAFGAKRTLVGRARQGHCQPNDHCCSTRGGRRRSLQLVNPESSCLRPLASATFTKPSPWFTILLPCFFPVCLAGTPQIPSAATKGV